MFDMDRLSTPAKAEAMRFGHTAVVSSEELVGLLSTMSPYLLEGEHFAVKPLGSIAGNVGMFSVRIIPVVKLTH